MGMKRVGCKRNISEMTKPEDGRQEKRQALATLEALLVHESDLLTSEDHSALAQQGSSCLPNAIWRERVVQWCFDVVDRLDESRDVVYAAFSILDRFLSVLPDGSGDTRGDSNSKGEVSEVFYETASITSLFLAMRMSGRKIMRLSELLRLSRSGVSYTEASLMGNKIVSALTWKKRLVTPTDFIKAMIWVLQPAEGSEAMRPILDQATFYAEVSIHDGCFSGVSASLIAIGSLLNALRETQNPVARHCRLGHLFDSSRAKDVENLARKLRTTMDRCRRQQPEAEALGGLSLHAVVDGDAPRGEPSLSIAVPLRRQSNDNVHDLRSLSDNGEDESIHRPSAARSLSSAHGFVDCASLCPFAKRMRIV